MRAVCKETVLRASPIISASDGEVHLDLWAYARKRGVQVKRVRYKCDTCGAEHYEWIDAEAPNEIECIHACDGKMVKQFPRVATHFRPTRGKR